MMAYPTYNSDPGGNFDSDAHRRLQANVPSPDEEPLSVEDLITQRINKDTHLLGQLSGADEVVEILKDLEADGHSHQDDEGRWQNTEDGFAVLTGPIADEPDAPNSVAVIGLDPSDLTGGSHA